MTKAIIMGMKVGPSITDTSQSNRGTRGHHDPYPLLCPHTLGPHHYVYIIEGILPRPLMAQDRQPGVWYPEDVEKYSSLDNWKIYIVPAIGLTLYAIFMTWWTGSFRWIIELRLVP